MKSTLELPAGYRPILQIDLQKDKKKMLLINGIACVIIVALGVLGQQIVPVGRMFDIDYDWLNYVFRFIALLVGIVLYMVLHELVHGVFMRRFSGSKVKYGFTGMYAYAGSDAYFCKKHYIIIALAPVVVWGVVLTLICSVLSEQWFWVAYFIQINNLSGAAGDYYVTWKFRSLPADILVQDSGVAMTVYSAQ